MPVVQEDAGEARVQTRSNCLDMNVMIENPAWQDVVDVKGLVKRACDAAVASSDVSEPLSRMSGRPEITVALSDNATVQQLNVTHRNIDKPTNVLSFPSNTEHTFPGDDGHGYLGDVVLAYEVVADEAKTQNLNLEHHISHLVVHGFLHLLGYDHQTDEDAKKMEQLEISALSRLHIANPYADYDPPSSR